MSPLGNGRDRKDPGLSQVYRGNVSQVRFLSFYLKHLIYFLLVFHIYFGLMPPLRRA